MAWRAGEATTLGPIDGSDAGANGINASGDVVGRCSTEDGQPYWENYACLWQTSGAPIDLGQGSAEAINDRGQIVGNLTDTGAVLWQPN